MKKIGLAELDDLARYALTAVKYPQFSHMAMRLSSKNIL